MHPRRLLPFLALLVLALPLPLAAEDGDPGLLLIEIDGLSVPRLERALEEGTMPNLAGLVEGGSHRIGAWHTIGSSTTPVSQAGILHGDSSAVPGYRWWDRERGRLVEASDPDDVRRMEQAASASAAQDLLAGGGVSITNVFSGGAERSLVTVSRMTDTSLVGDTVRHLLDPPRATGLVVGFGDALRTSARHRFNGEAVPLDPAIERKVAMPILGPAVESALVDITTMAVVRAVEEGAPILYASLLPYDEIAHYAGPDHPAAAEALGRIDAAIGTIHAATAYAPRPYHLVVLSDHGQTPGRPFEERFSATLEDVVRAGLSPTLDPVVAGSGNLAHVYLERTGARLEHEAIEALAPGLIYFLAAHPGIGLVVTRDAAGHLLATGPAGSHDLTSGEVSGSDPLTVYGPHAADSLRHLAGPDAAGDLVVISTYDPVNDEVLPFERQASSHGGIGGPQTEAVLVYPSVLEPGSAVLELVGAEAVHAKVREWLEADDS